MKLPATWTAAGSLLRETEWARNVIIGEFEAEN
jgi:hypothetical protein